MNVVGLLLLAVPAAAPPATPGWGEVVGRVVFAGDKLPDNPIVKVTNDRDHCLAKGPIFEDRLVIDRKARGVRWVLVWLAPVKDFRKLKAGDLPIRPSLKVPAEASLRTPCCAFEPRVLGLQEGTALVYKNDGKVTHALKLDGGGINEVFSVPAERGSRHALKAHHQLVLVTCPIHTWMRAYVRVFPHPYFAVTDENGNFTIKDAPAGKWRLVLWQEESGYFPFHKKDDVGLIVEIKRGKTTDVGAVKFALPKD